MPLRVCRIGLICLDFNKKRSDVVPPLFINIPSQHSLGNVAKSSQEIYKCNTNIPLTHIREFSQHLKLFFLSFQENLPRKSKQKTTFFSSDQHWYLSDRNQHPWCNNIFYISPFVSFPDTAVLFRYPAFTGQINIV